MNIWMRAVSAIAILAASATVVISGELTPCDLGKRSAVNGENVSIRGRFGFTMHGMFLLTDSCKAPTQGAVVLFPDKNGVPHVDFELDPQALDRLRPFFRVNGGSAIACGVVHGVLFYKTHFRSKMYGAGPMGNGFGPRGAFKLALVLRSVDELRSCD